jgi:hypothetical protein
MHPIHFDGAKVMAKPETMTDEQCYSLWAHQNDYKYTGEDGEEHDARVWTEVWQPSKEDIEAVVAGMPIILQIHSYGLPPVALFTMYENGKPNND